MVTDSLWWELLIGLAAALGLAWIALVIALAIARPRGGLLQEAVRILPDTLRLVHRLAADGSLPPGVRIRLGLLLVYLAMPIDLIPDFIPVIGYADDAVIVTVVLRSVVRRAGLDAVGAHWPGTEDGFTALCRLTGLKATSDRTDEHPQRVRGHAADPRTPDDSRRDTRASRHADSVVPVGHRRRELGRCASTDGDQGPMRVAMSHVLERDLTYRRWRDVDVGAGPTGRRAVAVSGGGVAGAAPGGCGAGDTGHLVDAGNPVVCCG